MDAAKEPPIVPMHKWCSSAVYVVADIRVMGIRRFAGILTATTCIVAMFHAARRGSIRSRQRQA